MGNIFDNITVVHTVVFFDGKLQTLKVANDLQAGFSELFSDEPQILPSIDAPNDVPRCIFRSKIGTSLIVYGDRIDFEANLNPNVGYKDVVSSVVAATVAIVLKNDLFVRRIGMIIQARDDGELLERLNSSVTVPGYSDSVEKSLSFVKKENRDNYLINTVTTYAYNRDNEDNSKLVTVDVNTDKSCVLSQNNETLNVLVTLLTDITEEKLVNVFK